MIKLAGIALSALTLILTTAPASANPTTFAGYIEANNTQDFVLTSTSLSGGGYSVTISSTSLVSFTYDVGGTPFGSTGQLATLNFTATSTFSGNCPSSATCGGGASYTESGFSGSFSFTSVIPFGTRTNLLSGTFGSGAAQLSSSMSANTATLEGTSTSTNPNQVTFTSDFLNFANTIGRDAKFSLSTLTPIFAVKGNTGTYDGFPVNFNAVGVGTFADLEAPEPSTFGLLASGLLAFAFWQRKRKRLHA